VTIIFRNFRRDGDFERIGAFLAALYQPRNPTGNWLQPEWEYAFFHPLMDEVHLARIGIWEQDGEIVGVVYYGWHLGDSFYFFHPEHRELLGAMLDYAETELKGVSSIDGRHYLCAFVNELDRPFLDLVQSRGYTRDPESDMPAYHMGIPDPFPAVTLPPGFRLQSLADECDWAKVHRALWRGFDHGDDVPMNDEEYESRRKMFDTPSARRDLKIVAVAPNGEYAAFCGMFYDSANHYALVEPVATVPEYRRLGIGRAVVLEGMRRCAALGAREAYVGNDLPVYRSLGFEKLFIVQCWVKYWG